MDSVKRCISPSLFGIILLCFFFPFVTITCGGKSTGAEVQLTGMQLATGWSADKHKEDPNPLAIGALVLAVAGVGLGFWQHRSGAVASSIVGGMGVVCLLILKTLFDTGVAKEGEGMLSTSWESGFVISLVLFAGACGYNIFLMVQNKGSTAAGGMSMGGGMPMRGGMPMGGGISMGGGTPMGDALPVGGGPAAPPVGRDGPVKFCAKCGTRNPVGNEYCNKCGNKLRSLDPSAPEPISSGVVSQAPVTPPAPSPQQVPVKQSSGSSPASYETWISGNAPIGFLAVQRPGRDELIPLNKAQFSFGSHEHRADYCEFRPGIDPVHASFVYKNGQYFVIDHGSQAGTYLNGRRLNPNSQEALNPGDAVMLGDIEYTFDMA